CHSHPSAQRILRLFTLLYPRPSRSTLFPYTTLFRSVLLHARTTRILRQAHGQFSATHVRTSFINKELLMMHSSSDAAVEAVDLVKTYPSGRRSEPVRAIDMLNFSVEAGCVFGLLGPNGAGKSTTIKILSTLAHPDSGTAMVAGAAVVNNPEKVRRAIGFVAQDSVSDPAATGRENLMLAARLHG